MVFIGEDVGLAFVPAQLNNDFNFNWLLKKVYVSNRRVFPNTTGYTGTPNQLIGSFCRVYWGPDVTTWHSLPTLDFAGATNPSSYFERDMVQVTPGSQYIYYTDRYRCATVGIGGTYVEYYDYRMSLLFSLRNTLYVPETATLHTIRTPEYLSVSWLVKDSEWTNIDFRGAVGYAVVIVKGDYSTFKAGFDQLNGISFLHSAYAGTTEKAISILDPVPADNHREYEYVHNGFRTTNKLLATFVSGGETYSIVAMKGKLSSQPAYPDSIITKSVSQPYLITDMQSGVPVPERVLLIGAEYYGF